jgi:hypothetical protein
MISTTSIRGWVRGPTPALLALIAMFVLDYSTLRGVGGCGWPVDTWQMYSGKAHVEPWVQYRRFVAYYEDGHSDDANLGDPISFLDKAYRADAGVGRNLPWFLVTCLRAMRKTDDGRHIVGLGYEERTWEYFNRSFADHRKDVPDRSFRAMVTPPIDPALRARDLGASLLPNGGFVEWDRFTGGPLDWSGDEDKWLGFGFAASSSQDRSVLIQKAPTGRVQTLRASALLPASGPATGLELTALVRATAGVSRVELSVADAEGATTAVESVPVVADGAWHRIAVRIAYPAGDRPRSATVVFHAGGDTYVDDVVLVETR